LKRRRKKQQGEHGAIRGKGNLHFIKRGVGVLIERKGRTSRFSALGGRKSESERDGAFMVSAQL